MVSDIFTGTFLWQSGSVSHASKIYLSLADPIYALGDCKPAGHQQWSMQGAFLVVFGRNNINNCEIKSYKTLFPVIFGYNAVSAQTQAWPTQYDRKYYSKGYRHRILGILVQTAPEYSGFD